MVDRSLRTQRWLVIWDCLTHVESESLCTDRHEGRWAGRPSLAMSVGANQMKVTHSYKWSKLRFTFVKFISSKCVTCRQSESKWKQVWEEKKEERKKKKLSPSLSPSLYLSRSLSLPPSLTHTRARARARIHAHSPRTERERGGGFGGRSELHVEWLEWRRLQRERERDISERGELWWKRIKKNPMKPKTYACRISAALWQFERSWTC